MPLPEERAALLAVLAEAVAAGGDKPSQRRILTTGGTESAALVGDRRLHLPAADGGSSNLCRRCALAVVKLPSVLFFKTPPRTVADAGPLR